MASDASDDDSFMYRLALDLIRKHEDAVERSGSATADGALDTLMPAVMAARHVIVWHIGAEPSPTEIAAFAAEFPDWSLIDAACSGRIEPDLSRERDGGRTRSDVLLTEISKRFLEAYAHRYLDGANAAKHRPAHGTGHALRVRLASGTKRH